MGVRRAVELFLRHTVLLTVALLLIVGAIFRQEIFQLKPAPEKVPPPDQFKEPVEVSAVALPVTEPLQPPPMTVEATPSQVQLQPPSDLAEMISKVSVAAPPPSTTIKHREGDLPEQDLLPSPVLAEDSLQEQAVNLDSDERDAPSLVPEVVDLPAPLVDANVLLSAARSAYWQGEMALAEARYRELISIDPSGYDGHGELANIYLSQGKFDLAGDEFSETCRLMIAAGERQQARALVRRLGESSPELKEQLHQQFFGD
ncbi:MAG: hypothetical protein ABW185_14550 [Sedimenticola sp.]